MPWLNTRVPPSEQVAWWDYNERTAFFRHPETARRVRMLLKAREAEVA